MSWHVLGGDAGLMHLLRRILRAIIAWVEWRLIARFLIAVLVIALVLRLLGI